MAAAGGAAFSSVIDHRAIIRDATAEAERASALREMLRNWLVSGTIQIRQGGGPRGSTVPRAGLSVGGAMPTAALAGGDELTFLTNAINPAMAQQVRIRLYVDADPNTPETGLTIEYQPNTQTPLQRKQLDPTIGVLKVEFLDRRTGRWYPASEAATVQPRAYRVTLLPPDRGTIPGILMVPMNIVIGDPATNNGSLVPGQ